MPNQFMLKRDGAAVPFFTVDEEMCAHFGATVDPVKWFASWHDIQGFSIACGTSTEKFKELWRDDAQAIAIWDWLHANFEPYAWYSR